MPLGLVSIVVPCFNARRWIVETLATTQQVCSVPVEVIVVDDGSTDGSADAIRAAFPDVRVVTTENRGVSHARNLGISLARGDAFVFLDADDLLVEDALDRHGARLETSGADVVYGDWQRLRAQPGGSFARAETITRTIDGAADVALFGGMWWPTGAYMFRRGIVERVGGFSASLPVIQDAHFAIDCALHGARFEHAGGVACLYRVHETDSVSTRSRTGFLRDCLASARIVRDWWTAHGGITEPRRLALVGALEHVAAGGAERDDAIFRETCTLLDEFARIDDPVGHAAQRMAARLVGQRASRRLVHLVRRTRARLRGR
jgi:glycosyltransferase involved in cell wall biosynthesis